MKIKDVIRDFVIMPQSVKPMGLIHKPGAGPNNRFDFINKGNNRGNETKEAPPGTYFTKGGNLVKGRLTRAAKDRGARQTDPKDSQRSMDPENSCASVFYHFTCSQRGSRSTNHSRSYRSTKRYYPFNTAAEPTNLFNIRQTT